MIGRTVLRYRLPIGIVLLAFTGYMAYCATHVIIATRFVDFFPRNHPNVKLYHEFERYGGAQTLTIMVQARRGGIFNIDTLTKIQKITFALDKFPGVAHQSIRSLASFRVTYAVALPGFLKSQPYMYPMVPKTRAGIEELKKQVFTHRRQLRNLVSPDDKSALVTASFYEGGLDYHDLFNRAQQLVKRYQDADTRVYVVGEPIVRGYGYYYLPVLILIFVISDALMILILYGYFRGRGTWWAPIVTGLLSTIWGLGFIGWQGFEFDPVMLVIRFILTARDMSHGIQWQGRYYDELEARNYDKYAACEATTTLMLPPGLLSILADIAGIVFISFGGIPSLQHVASSGAVWLGGSLTMVFIFQPIMMSYLPTPKPLVRRKSRRGWLSRVTDKLVDFPVTPGFAREGALVAVGVLIVVGFIAGVRAKIGYTQPGTPLYRYNAKVNRDMRAVGKFFPLDEGWVIMASKKPALIQGQIPSVIDPDNLRAQRDLGQFLLLDRDVAQVSSVTSGIIEPYNQMFHYSDPKYSGIPGNLLNAGGLWALFEGNSAPDEPAQWVSDQYDDMILRIYIRNHTYATLKRLQRRLEEFTARRQGWDPAFRHMKVMYLGGIAGLYAAANDVLYQLDFINITFVLGVVFLFCAITYRSMVAGVLFVISCVAANFAAFIYMRLANIGITIDTIPVISLGIGLGVDYGIYCISRVRDECAAGLRLEDAITTALRGTGAAVLATVSVIVGGLAPWVFSPVLFHNEMSVLLIILMFTNLIVGLLILPAYVAWARPRFIFGGRYEREPERAVAACN